MESKFFINQLLFLITLIPIYFIFKSIFSESQFWVYIIILFLISLISSISFSLFNIFYKNSDIRNFSYKNMDYCSPWKGFVNLFVLILILLFIPTFVIPYFLKYIIENIYPWYYFIFFIYAFFVIFLIIKNLDVLNYFFNTHFIRKKIVNIENPLLMFKLVPHMDSEIYFTEDGIYWNISNNFFNFYKWNYFNYYVEDLGELYPIAKNTVGLFIKKEYQNTFPKRYGRRDIIQIPLKDEYKEKILDILNSKLTKLTDIKNNS